MKFSQLHLSHYPCCGTAIDHLFIVSKCQNFIEANEILAFSKWIFLLLQVEDFQRRAEMIVSSIEIDDLLQEFALDVKEWQ